MGLRPRLAIPRDHGIQVARQRNPGSDPEHREGYAPAFGRKRREGTSRPRRVSRVPHWHPAPNCLPPPKPRSTGCSRTVGHFPDRRPHAVQMRASLFDDFPPGSKLAPTTGRSQRRIAATTASFLWRSRRRETQRKSRRTEWLEVVVGSAGSFGYISVMATVSGL
jgi:hypothetical protein